MPSRFAVRRLARTLALPMREEITVADIPHGFRKEPFVQRPAFGPSFISIKGLATKIASATFTSLFENASTL